MRLLIVRHGESYANAEGLIQGQGESPKFDLSARGRAQARACGERLDREGLKPTHVYASPLSRTAETARLIVERWGMDIEYWDDLMEHDMGSASGLTLAELSARHPDLDIALEGIRGFSGLPGAESWRPAPSAAAGQYTRSCGDTRRTTRSSSSPTAGSCSTSSGRSWEATGPGPPTLGTRPSSTSPSTSSAGPSTVPTATTASGASTHSPTPPTSTALGYNPPRPTAL